MQDCGDTQKARGEIYFDRDDSKGPHSDSSTDRTLERMRGGRITPPSLPVETSLHFP
jgi:hypothetical protein